MYTNPSLILDLDVQASSALLALDESVPSEQTLTVPFRSEKPMEMGQFPCEPASTSGESAAGIKLCSEASRR